MSPSTPPHDDDANGGDVANGGDSYGGDPDVEDLSGSPSGSAAQIGLGSRAVPLRRLIRELTDLKRIRSHRHSGAMSGYRFEIVISQLADMASVAPCFDEVADRIGDLALEHLTLGIIATRTGAMDPDSLKDLNCSEAILHDTFAAAINEHAPALGDLLPDVTRALNRVIDRRSNKLDVDPEVQRWIDALRDEPRAGATAAGKSRTLVMPTESQADHCYLVALLATLLSPLMTDDAGVAAKPGEVFLTGLFHHAHNAVLPDGGFSAEVLLGGSLGEVIELARQSAASTLPHAFGRAIRTAADRMSHLRTAESRTCNAADAIDRVLQAHYHEQVAKFDAVEVSRRLELVHEGPLQSFQNDMLRAVGIES